MRQIYIDLTSENSKPLAGKCIGHIGEHNAAELILTVPQSLTDESDYLVAVFQSGALTFRSRRIYPDGTNESAYRVGNCVHCLLGRHLTNEPFLGVQIEGYKLDTDEAPMFIGKTQFVSRLMLKPSPHGHPGFGFDGSYEDVQSAIDFAHNHTNLASLTKVGETQSGQFTFNGREISGGIASYYDFDSLPDNAESGTLACVENDTAPQFEETIVPKTRYSSIGIKAVPDSTAFDNMPLVTSTTSDEGEVQTYICEMYMERLGEDESPCYIQTVYVPGIASLFIVEHLEKERIESAYVPDSSNDDFESSYYLYNFIDNLDITSMTDNAEPGTYPAGWYRITEKRVNCRAENYNLYYDVQTIIEPVSFEDTPLTSLFNNCRINYYDENEYGNYINEAELSIMLTKLFYATTSLSHRKGLYLFDGSEWLRFKSGDIAVVENRFALPENADEGDLAFVQNSLYIYNHNSSVINEGTIMNAVYVNPCLNALARLHDVEMSAVYGYYGNDPNTGTSGMIPTGGGGFEFITNVENDYALLSISPYNLTSDRVHYIYSWTEQTLQFSSGSALNNSEAIEIPLSVGWNHVEMNTGTGEYYGVSLIDDPNDLPALTVDSYNVDITYLFGFTACSSTWFGNNFSQNYFSDEPFFTNDNATGLWGYFGGSWQKLENNLIYSYEYGDDN